MSINPLYFQILNPNQTAAGAGLNATGQSVQNTLMPKMLGAQMFNQEMLPLSIMGQSPMMALLPQYRDAWAQAIGTAMRNVAPNAQNINFSDIDQMQQAAYSKLGEGGLSILKTLGILPSNNIQQGLNQQNPQNPSGLRGIVSSFAGSQNNPQQTMQQPTQSQSPQQIKLNQKMSSQAQSYNPLAPYIKQYNLTNLNDLGGGWYTALSNGKPVKFKVPEIANAK